MVDPLRALSDALARDPGSLAFLELAEALRHRGELPHARQVALLGLERHPHLADAHDLLARVLADMGATEGARDEWEIALRLAPEHVGARVGLGFLAFRLGRLDDAERHLGEASALAPDDATVHAALGRVRAARPAPPSTPKPLVEPEFALATEGEQVDVLVLDAEGLVLAGSLRRADGVDVAPDVGGALAGVAQDGLWAAEHLGLGAWQEIVVETSDAAVALAPVGEGGVLLVAARSPLPLGRLRRILRRCCSLLMGAGA